MMVIAIVGILATIGTNTYRVYILKAETAQTLVDYGQIRTTIAVASQVDGRTNLQLGSVPGAPPPALKDQLAARVFNGRDGIKFQLVKAPPGLFASYPTEEVYALIGTAENPAAVRRLRILQDLLPHGSGDKIWSQNSVDAGSAQLTYPIDAGAGTELVAGGPSGGSDSAAPESGTESGNGASNGEVTTPPAGGGTPSTGNGPGGNQPEDNQSAEPIPPDPPKVASSASGTAERNGNSWTASSKICISGKDGKPLTGQTNTSIRYRVITTYANFQEDLKVDPATGCVDKDYGGLPLGGTFRIEVSQVVDYNPPNSGGTSSLWDGVTPTLQMTGPK